MLATTAARPRDLDGWAVEPKLDGWRATVIVDGDDLAVRSRRGRHLTECVPELEPLKGTGRRVVLDGELIIGAGRIEDFYALSGRLSGRPKATAPRVVFVAFDVVWLDGRPLVGERYEHRRKVLEDLDLGPARVTPSYPGADADALLSGCEREGMEGVVLKRLASPYRPGARSRDWVKLKCPAWRDHLERRRPPA
jgi:bifunctional non-homologous end joining protein LigD